MCVSVCVYKYMCVLAKPYAKKETFQQRFIKCKEMSTACKIIHSRIADVPGKEHQDITIRKYLTLK